MWDTGHGLTREGVIGLAYSTVAKRPHPFRNGSRGRAWFECFMRQNANAYNNVSSVIVLLSSSLQHSSKKEAIADLCGKLGSLYGRLNMVSRPIQIFNNCDETGVTILFKPNKVVAELGKRNVYALSAAKKENSHCFCYVSRQQVLRFPPVMIYLRKISVPDKLKEGSYPNTLFVSSGSGWVNDKLFVKWFVSLECTQPA